MLKYIFKRFAQSLVTLFIVVSVVFLLMRLLPVEGYFGDGYDKLAPEQRVAALQRMGLLSPWYVQLGNFYGKLAKGDMGVSIIYRRDIPVTEVIAPRIPYSMYFGITATLLALLLGLTLGVFMARKKGMTVDKAGTAYIVLINAVP
jgi:oligopeptide transport system permease protein